MNILIATDVFPPKSGGSGWSTFHLARALQGCGHRVEIALPKAGGRGIEPRVYEGLDVFEVGYRATNMPGLRAWQRTRALEEAFSAYLARRAPEFDLIHAQHLLSIGAASAARRIVPIPVVSTVRDYWAVCLYGTLWRDSQVCSICRGGEITKCLAQKYGASAAFMLPAVPFVERELKRRQRVLKESDAVIAVSGFVGEMLDRIVPRGKMHVVPNLIDIAETRQAAQSGDARGSGASYLMFIGKLNALKGADLLPEILAQSGVNMPLVIAGDGEYGAKLSQTAGIEVRGWLANSEALGLLSRATALLFPSRWAEPLARTLLEAQALGIPTVAWNSGGTRDIIKNNFNGVLANSVQQFAEQLRRVTADAELRARLGANALHVAQEKFSAGVVTTQLETIYGALVKGSQ